MHREIRRHVFGAAVAELSKVEAGEEVLARAQEDGTEGEVQLVNQTGAKELLDGGDTAGDRDALVFPRRVFTLKSTAETTACA